MKNHRNLSAAEIRETEKNLIELEKGLIRMIIMNTKK